MVNRRRGALTLGLFLTAALAGGVLPAAAAVPFTIRHDVGDESVIGDDAGAGASVKVVHRRGTQVLSTRTTTADGSGEWVVYTRASKAGDRLVVTIAGTKRTITVPDLRIAIDPVTDTVSGRVPTSNLVFELDIKGNIGDYGWDYDGDGGDDPANGDGTFAYTPSFPINGGDEAIISWFNAAGDRFSRIRALPSVSVRSGSPKVDGLAVAGSEVTIRLRTAGGDLRGTFYEDLDPAWDDSFDGFFRKNGAKVKVAPGNRVTHSGMPGASLRVRTPDVAIDPSGTGTLTATCFVGGRALIGRIDPEEAGLSAFGAFALEPDGTLTVPDLTLIAPVNAGDRWLVVCETPSGMAQEMVGTVPAS